MVPITNIILRCNISQYSTSTIIHTTLKNVVSCQHMPPPHHIIRYSVILLQQIWFHNISPSFHCNGQDINVQHHTNMEHNFIGQHLIQPKPHNIGFDRTFTLFYLVKPQWTTVKQILTDQTTSDGTITVTNHIRS